MNDSAVVSNVHSLRSGRAFEIFEDWEAGGYSFRDLEYMEVQLTALKNQAEKLGSVRLTFDRWLVPNSIKYLNGMYRCYDQGVLISAKDRVTGRTHQMAICFHFSLMDSIDDTVYEQEDGPPLTEACISFNYVKACAVIHPSGKKCWERYFYSCDERDSCIAAHGLVAVLVEKQSDVAYRALMSD